MTLEQLKGCIPNEYNNFGLSITFQFDEGKEVIYNQFTHANCHLNNNIIGWSFFST